MSASHTAPARTELSGFERLRQNDRTACRVIDGKAIVITIDRNQLHVLNGSATRIWELMDGRSIANIVEVVVSEFEVEPDQAARDVYAFAEQLLIVGAADLIREDR